MDGKGPDHLRPGQVGRAARSRIRPFPLCIIALSRNASCLHLSFNYSQSAFFGQGQQGLVHLRQRFVRRCQGRDPGHTGIRGWPGQVKAEQIEGRVRPFPLCKTQGRTLLKWRRRRPGNLFVCAKDLFVEAMAAHTHGPMPARSALKGRGSSSDGDARGVAGAVHADALQQWRQTAS